MTGARTRFGGRNEELRTSAGLSGPSPDRIAVPDERGTNMPQSPSGDFM